MKEMENWDFQISTNQYPLLENFSQFTKEIKDWSFINVNTYFYVFKKSKFRIFLDTWMKLISGSIGHCRTANLSISFKHVEHFLTFQKSKFQNFRTLINNEADKLKDVSTFHPSRWVMITRPLLGKGPTLDLGIMGLVHSSKIWGEGRGLKIWSVYNLFYIT